MNGCESMPINLHILTVSDREENDFLFPIRSRADKLDETNNA